VNVPHILLKIYHDCVIQFFSSAIAVNNLCWGKKSQHYEHAHERLKEAPKPDFDGGILRDLGLKIPKNVKITRYKLPCFMFRKMKTFLLV
jgi:hypothetical protein